MEFSTSATSASVSVSVLSVVVLVCMSSSLALLSSADVLIRRLGDSEVIDSMSDVVVLYDSCVSCASYVLCVLCESWVVGLDSWRECVCMIVLWIDSGVECMGVFCSCMGVLASIVTKGVLGRGVWLTGVIKRD